MSIEFSAGRLKAPDFQQDEPQHPDSLNGKLILLAKFEANTDALQKFVATILVL
jgi:hypothetical protein